MKVIDLATFAERILLLVLFALILSLIAGTVIWLAQYVLTGCVEAPPPGLIP
ncbi:MAG: hypothetical protein JWM43_205 [Acidobacteriaceae bacterium]|nr:hypothetical protein [Acidobacteriaceae bacterium]